ncbi:hypothetical protein SAMN05216464_111147 [Mucilaginibacter pineti]|uniref:Uncharacterized protein n=1 Tax=Mucilaginibacter pineti TaxID=1391627 RepID=A0A1G7HB80_9SPHI|nr:hypothetical protein SAMN05216464_111147 [Mucilaginibacter pineti]
MLCNEEAIDLPQKITAVFYDIRLDARQPEGIGELQADGFLMRVKVWVSEHGYQNMKLAIQETILQDVKDAGIRYPVCKVTGCLFNHSGSEYLFDSIYLQFSTFG